VLHLFDIGTISLTAKFFCCLADKLVLLSEVFRRKDFRQGGALRVGSCRRIS